MIGVSWVGSVGTLGTSYPLVGSVGSTGFNGCPFPSFGVNPGTYGTTGLSVPGFVGLSLSFGYTIGVVVCPGMFGIHDPNGL